MIKAKAQYIHIIKPPLIQSHDNPHWNISSPRHLTPDKYSDMFILQYAAEIGTGTVLLADSIEDCFY